MAGLQLAWSLLLSKPQTILFNVIIIIYLMYGMLFVNSNHRAISIFFLVYLLL
jgi:hypothetical protein